MTAKLINPEILRSVHGLLTRGGTSIINEGSVAAPILMLFKVVGDTLATQKISAASIVPPHEVNAMQRSAVSKKAMMDAIIDLLSDGEHSVDIVGHLTEAWRADVGDPGALQRALALSDAGVSVEDMPGRSEMLMISLHTLEGTYTSAAVITTDATGKRHCAGAPLDAEGVTVGGRMLIGGLGIKP